jgi:serine/threonine-protein kinase
MSPEHLNARRVDHRSDLYSLGVVLYEALSGRLPFLGEDAAQVLAGHLYEAPAPLVGVEPEVARVVSWLLAKNPAERPENARMARHALERLLLARAV